MKNVSIPAIVMLGVLSMPNSGYAEYNSSSLTSVKTVAGLEAVGAVSPTNPQIFVKGYYASGDGGGGVFVWDATSTATSDGCLVFQATGVSTGRWVRQLSNPHALPLEACGAIPNSLATDYTARIQAALAYAASKADLVTDNNPTESVTVECNGKFQLSAQLVVKPGVIFDGSASRYGCYLYPVVNFSGLTTTGAIRIGDGTGPVYNAFVKNVQIVHYTPGIQVNGSIDFYTSDCQDKCGFVGDGSNGYSGSGFVVDGSAGTFGSVNTYVLERNEAFGNQAGTVTGPAYLIKNGTFPGIVIGNDAYCYSGHCPANGMQFTNIPAIVYSQTIEGNFTNGIQIDSGVPYGSVIGLTAKDATTSIHISTVNPFTVADIWRVNGTNVLVDDGGSGYTANTLTQTTLPFYSRGGKNYFSGNVYMTGSANIVGKICDDFSTISCRLSMSVDSAAVSHIAATNNQLSFDTGSSGTTNRANVPANGGFQVVPTTSASVLAITCNAAEEGVLYPVTDANSASFNSALAGGGSNHVVAYCNGSSWVVH